MTETRAEHCLPQIVFQVDATVHDRQANSVAHTSRRQQGTNTVINAVAVC